jgi:multiple sugar transport system ATP-binding protein
LSGGQRQRVALGRAMVRHPKVFLMDEPLSNLDAKLRVDTRAEIAQLHRQLRATFMYVTHDQVEAMTMADRVALMVDGRLLQVAPPQEIYDDPADLRVAAFIGTPRINTLHAQPVVGGFEMAGCRWALDVPGAGDAAVQLAVRPEWFQLCAPDDHPGGSRPAGVGVLQGSLVHFELLGAETLLHVRLSHQAEPVVARVAPDAARHLGVGSTVGLRTRQVLAFDAQGRRLRDVRWTHEWRPEVVHG